MVKSNHQKQDTGHLGRFTLMMPQILTNLTGNSKICLTGPTNASHSTLYPDVLKIKAIIVEKQNFAKMPFVYYLQIHKSIADNSAAWTSWQQYGQIMDL